MALRQRLIAAAGTLVLLGMTLVPGLGQEMEHVATSSVTVLPGKPLSASLAWTSLDAYDLGPITGVSGGMVLHMRDDRGVASGWTVTLSAREFVGPKGYLGASQLTVEPGPIAVAAGNPDTSGLRVTSVDPSGSSSALRWIAEPRSGDGQYDLALNGGVLLPWAPTTDGYAYTVVVSIQGATP